jgi:hypothetical protein
MVHSRCQSLEAFTTVASPRFDRLTDMLDERSLFVARPSRSYFCNPHARLSVRRHSIATSALSVTLLKMHVLFCEP